MTRDLDPIQSLWISQDEQKEMTMSLAEIRSKAELFQSRVGRRNLIEYVAGAVVIACFTAFTIVMPEPLLRLGAVMIVLGTAMVLWNLHRQARRAGEAEMQAGASSWADFHRAELVRQRDALRGVWLWYLAPPLPGMVVFLAGSTRVWSGETAALTSFGVAAAVVAAVFAAVAWLNARAAAHLQAEIEALDRSRVGDG